MKNNYNDDMNPLVTTNEINNAQTEDVFNDFCNTCGVDNLIFETINNGFEKDLCLNSNDLKNKKYSLLHLVNQKLQSKIYKINYKNIGLRIHNRRNLMLSLIMYTSCDCNYDLCKCQRNGNYDKWRIFDDNLYRAIYSFHIMEDYLQHDCKHDFIIYSGLNKVQLRNKKGINFFYFPTYVSTSYNVNISKKLAKNNGMLIQFDKNIVSEKQFIFCSLEWISKFPNECEILVARKTYDSEKALTMNVIDNEIKCNKSDTSYLQIAQVSCFDSKKLKVTLLSKEEMERWNKIFQSGINGKNDALNTFTQLDINTINEHLKERGNDIFYFYRHKDYVLKDFQNGVNLMYSDSIFKQYCEKFNQHNNLTLDQSDIVYMQTQSKIMKKLVSVEVKSSRYVPSKWSHLTFRQKYNNMQQYYRYTNSLQPALDGLIKEYITILDMMCSLPMVKQ